MSLSRDDVHDSRRSVRYLLLTVLPFFLLTGATRPSAADQRFGIWGGGAPGSPHLISHIPSRQIGLVAFQYARDVRQTRFGRVEYTADVIPAVLIAQPREQGVYLFTHSGAIRSIDQSAHVIWGAGVMPVGVRITAGTNRRLAPYVALSGGGVLTREKVPYQTPGGTAANFIFQMGGGLRFAATPTCEAMLGYAWWHLSNARLSPINPGIDANLFYLGVLFS